jgi:cytochrome c oxidase subunit 2
MKARHNAKVDAAAWDDIIQKDTLYLCANKEYEMNFRSKDVIHSAHFPYFRAQMNTVPGMTTRFKFTPDVTTKQMRERMGDSKFNYVLLCNKICGGAHYKMKMIVVVLGEKEYKKWFEAKQAATFKSTFFGATEEKEETPAEGTTPADSTGAVVADTLKLASK